VPKENKTLMIAVCAVILHKMGNRWAAFSDEELKVLAWSGNIIDDQLFPAWLREIGAELARRKGEKA
jgi:hypothetical protein